MKRWWQDSIAWLMLISFLLVILLSGSWLYNTYQSDRDSMMKDATHLFTNAIRSLEDSLIQENVIVHFRRGPGDFTAGRNATRSGVDDSTQIIVLKKEARAERDRRAHPLRTFRRRMLSRPDRGFTGSLSFLLGALRDTIRPPQMDDTVSVQAVQDAIERQLDLHMKPQDLPYAYHLHSTADSLSYRATTKPYHDVSTKRHYALVLKDYRGHLIKGMLPEMLFTLMLLIFTALAFITSHRSMAKQRRLSLLKNELVSNITHELKTPIATVRVALEALQSFDAGQDPERTKEYIEISQNELMRLEILVDNVLKASVAEGKEMQLNLEQVNMHTLVSEILETMKLQFEKMRASVHFNSTASQQLLKADRVHLTSIIYNLLDNALKYSQGSPKIDVNLRVDANDVVLDIVDDGFGIPKAYQSRIFEKFFRVPTHNVHDTKGYGLGLNYVKKVVEQHGGSITVQDAASRGTVFTIRLPKSI